MKKRTEGFTLAELLVVVAIIGVLVAVSIPIFTGQLGKARIATDQANVRAAKVAAVAEYLSSGVAGEKYYFYDAASGTVKSSLDGIKGYGKSTAGNGETGAGGIPVSSGKANLVKVTVNADAGATPYTAEWVAGDGSSTGGSGSGGSGTSGSNSSGADSSGGSSSGGSSSSSTALDPATAVQYPEKPTGEYSFSIETGKRYLYNGALYIATTNKSYSNQWNYFDPSTDWAKAYFVIPNGTILSDSNVSDPANLNGLNDGDVYVTSDGKQYIRVSGGSTGQSPAIDHDTNRWVEIIN